MIRAVEKVCERLMRATAALEAAGIPYAVAGENAVAARVSRVDEAAVRHTQDVDILIRREDFHRVEIALARCGFVYRQTKCLHLFLDGSNGTTRDAIHLVFAGKKVREKCLGSAPAVNESEEHDRYQVLRLDPHVRMMLARCNAEDGMLTRDLIDVGLVNASWLDRLPPELAARLKELLDNPEAKG
jgi:hypothetical protein